MSSPLRIFLDKKSRGQKLAMISLYDAPSAKICADSGVDALLVGDSLGNVILGFESTIPVTMDDMIRHTGAVLRGVQSSSNSATPVVADLPFGSYGDERSAVKNGVALMQIGAHSVKLEGAGEIALRAIDSLVQTGTPVMGHLGFTPQSSLQKNEIVQGKTGDSAQKILEEARKLEAAGCFAIVLETVALETAAEITQALSISTIGIGAGPDCDGQVLVWHDLIGLSEHKFRFVKKYADAHGVLSQAAGDYIREVQGSAFPTSENGWKRTS